MQTGVHWRSRVPLPAPVSPREPVYGRQITLDAFRRSDCLWDFGGHVTDLRHHDLRLGHFVRLRSQQPSLLVGLVFDGKGRAMTPTHVAKPGKRYLVLGDMGELGADALTMHADIGTYARHAELDGLFALGTLTAQTVIELGRDGWHFESLDDLLDELDKVLAPDVTVLVKGSRFMKMERVVEKLVPDFNKHNHAHGAH